MKNIRPIAPQNTTIDIEKSLSIADTPNNFTQEQSLIKNARPNSPSLPGVIKPNVNPANNDCSASRFATSGFNNRTRYLHLKNCK